MALRECDLSTLPGAAREALRRQAVERELHQIPRTVHVTMITLTIGCDEIVSGRKHLIAAFADLRRAPGLGGRRDRGARATRGSSSNRRLEKVECSPSHASVCAVAYACGRAAEPLAVPRLAAQSRRIVLRIASRKPLRTRNACEERPRGWRVSSPCAYYVTKRRRAGTAGVYRRTGTGLPPWDTRASMGHSLRKDSGGVVTRPRCRRLPNKTEREPVDGSETSGRPDVLTQVRRTK